MRLQRAFWPSPNIPSFRYCALRSVPIHFTWHNGPLYSMLARRPIALEAEAECIPDQKVKFIMSNVEHQFTTDLTERSFPSSNMVQASGTRPQEGEHSR
jgi:hypothetical protein